MSSAGRERAVLQAERRRPPRRGIRFAMFYSFLPFGKSGTSILGHELGLVYNVGRWTARRLLTMRTTVAAGQMGIYDGRQMRLGCLPSPAHRVLRTVIRNRPSVH